MTAGGGRMKKTSRFKILSVLFWLAGAVTGFHMGFYIEPRPLIAATVVGGLWLMAVVCILLTVKEREHMAPCPSRFRK